MTKKTHSWDTLTIYARRRRCCGPRRGGGCAPWRRAPAPVDPGSTLAGFEWDAHPPTWVLVYPSPPARHRSLPVGVRGVIAAPGEFRRSSDRTPDRADSGYHVVRPALRGLRGRGVQRPSGILVPLGTAIAPVAQVLRERIDHIAPRSVRILDDWAAVRAAVQTTPSPADQPSFAGRAKSRPPPRRSSEVETTPSPVERSRDTRGAASPPGGAARSAIGGGFPRLLAHETPVGHVVIQGS